MIVPDYETGEYHDVTIDNIDRAGSTVEIEGYDNTIGEYRTFELEGCATLQDYCWSLNHVEAPEHYCNRTHHFL